MSVARVWFASLSLTLLWGCGGGGSDVGDQPDQPPVAAITVIGSTASGAGSSQTATVRSGAEVLLSGKDSSDPDDPINEFEWQVVSGNVALLRVASNTVRFTAPDVLTDTTLTLGLTVRTADDGNQQSASQTIDVLVKPGVDADRFLDYVETLEEIQVLAVRDGATPQIDDVPFEVSVQLRVTYPTRDGGTAVYEGTPVVRNANWSGVDGLAGRTLAEVLADVRVPRVLMPLPLVNLDEINQPFLLLPAEDPGRNNILDVVHEDARAAALAGRAPISSVYVFKLVAPTVPGGIDDGRIVLLDGRGNDLGLIGANSVALNPDTGQMETTLEVPTDTLTSTAAAVDGQIVVENAATAQAYYDTIDPNGERLTLNAWLAANCMNPDAPDLGADAHAVYTNNFDLGFGRDMYLKTLSANDACGAPGDVASVVINYPSLEGAARKIAPFIAVAMEYAKPIDLAQGFDEIAAAETVDPFDADHRFAKFYVFVPDDVTGEMVRVLSANFDGRGEKFVPGVCTTCHGGEPPLGDPLLAAVDGAGGNAANVYRRAGDIGAIFMPWDLDSLLYADTDPSLRPLDSPDFSPQDQAIRDQYGRSAQQEQFARLNEAVLATYPKGADAPVRRLVHGWYDDAAQPDDFDSDTLQTRTFDGSFVPEGWDVAGTTAVVPADLYRNVIAQNCRACHTQVLPEGSTARLALSTFAGFETAVASGLVTDAVYRRAVMPGARLTMDRFWVDYASGAPAAADLLAQHLGFMGADEVTPGVPLPAIAETATVDGVAVVLPEDQPLVRSERGETYRFDGSASRLTDTFAWSLQAPAASTADLYGATTPFPSFTADVAGDYTLTLVTSNALAESTAIERTVSVVNLLPVAAADAQATVEDQATQIDVLANDSFSADDGSVSGIALGAGDLPVTVSVAAGSANGATVSPNSADLASAAEISAFRFTYTPAAAFSGTDTFSYVLTDADGDMSASATVTVSVTSQLVVAPTIVAATNPSGTVATPRSHTDITVADLFGSDISGGSPTFDLTLSTPGSGTAMLMVDGAPQGSAAGALSGAETVDLVYTPGTLSRPDPGKGVGIDLDTPCPSTSCTDVEFTGQDTFQLSVSDSSTPMSQSGMAGVTVMVVPDVDFASDVLPNMTCLGGGCHSNGNGVRPVFDSGAAVETFRALYCGGYLDLASPAASPVIVVGNDSGGHTGGDALNATAEAALLEWMNEGAFGPLSTCL